MSQKQMLSSDVINFYNQLEKLGIKIWIDGGWGVDALLGEQTRSHGDLDIAIEQRHVEQVCDLLKTQGYKEIRRDNEWNFVMGDDNGHEIDFHAFVFDNKGHIIDGLKYPEGSLTDTGTIDGRVVSCISPEHLVEFHTGYPLRDSDFHDVDALCKKFNIEYPEEYKHFKSDIRMKSSELGLPIEYQQFPEFFDIPSNDNTNEKNKVIERLLSKYKSKSVFDMTCGTGAQVLYLANLGYSVIGSDFSPKLIEIARNKAAKQHLKIRFIDGDMRNLQVAEFDAVITIDNAIGHLVKDEFEIALRNIYKNLKIGGIYIFDILNLDAMTDEIIESDSKKMSNTVMAADGSIISNLRHTTIDRDKGYLTSDENITIHKDGKQKHVKNRCSLQIYTMDELMVILSRNGFKSIEQYKIDTYSFQQDSKGYGILTVAQKQ